MMKRTKIGFFDSGVGGLTVMHEAKKLLPDYDYIFYADRDNVPYGTKTHGEVLQFTEAGVESLLSYGADVIVIACNTATSVAVDTLRRKYTCPIIGMEPAVKLAHDRFSNSNILVTATPITIKGDKLHRLIEKLYEGKEQPDLVALPNLVELAESCSFDSDTVEAYLAESIADPTKYNAVVLGCTHFCYFRENFKKYLPNAKIIDGNEGTVHRLSAILGEKELTPNNCPASETVYLTSGRVEKAEEVLRRYKALTERL